MLGRHPTLWIAFINVVVMGAATLGFNWLDNDAAVLVVAAINALAAVANAISVRPIPVPVFTYAAASVIALLAHYGLNVTPDQLGGLNSVMVSVLGLMTYGNVSPVETAISQATSAQGRPEVQTVPEA